MTDRATRSPVVFVIAPDDVPVMVRAASASVLRFSSSDEFEKWRAGSAAQMSAAVHAALAELHVDLSQCSLRTQEVIARLCEREAVPSVKELTVHCSSRRSFYRSWQADIGETPDAFLSRVRLLRLHPPHAAQPGTSAEEKCAHIEPHVQPAL